MVGREAETLEIYDGLVPKDARVMISGASGSGKSMLMKAIVSNQQQLVQGLVNAAGDRPVMGIPFIFWFNGSTERTLKNGLIQFALNLLMPSIHAKLEQIEVALQAGFPSLHFIVLTVSVT